MGSGVCHAKVDKGADYPLELLRKLSGDRVEKSTASETWNLVFSDINMASTPPPPPPSSLPPPPVSLNDVLSTLNAVTSSRARLPVALAQSLTKLLRFETFFGLKTEDRLQLLEAIDSNLHNTGPRGVLRFLSSFGPSVYNASTFFEQVPLFGDPSRISCFEGSADAPNEKDMMRGMSAEERNLYFRILGAILGYGATPASFVSLLRTMHMKRTISSSALSTLNSAVTRDIDESSRSRSQSSFFQLDGNGSGIDVDLASDSWPFARDLTFFSAFSFDNFIADEDRDQAARSILCITAQNGDSFRLHPRGRKICVSVTIESDITSTMGGDVQLDPDTWYTIGVVAVKPRFLGKPSVTVYVNGKIYFQGNLPFASPRSKVKSLIFGHNLCGKMGPCILSNETFSQASLGLIQSALAQGSTCHFISSDIIQRALVSFHPNKCYRNMCIDLSTKIVSQETRGKMRENTSRWITFGIRDTLTCIGGTGVILSLLSTRGLPAPLATNSASTSNNVVVNKGVVDDITHRIVSSELDEPWSLADVLGILFLFLKNHEENIQNFVSSDGVSMLEYILRTAVLSIAVEDCDLLVTRLCALAKVQSGAKSAASTGMTSSNLQRLILRRILFRFSIWQRSPLPVQQRIMARLRQTLVENPMTISRVVGCQIFLDGCRDAYFHTSLKKRGGSSSPLSINSPCSKFRESVLRMLGVVLKHHMTRDDMEAYLRFLVNCENPETLRGGLKVLLDLFVDPGMNGTNLNVLEKIHSVIDAKDTRRLSFPIFLIRRLANYEDIQCRCLTIQLLTVYIANCLEGPMVSSTFSLRSIITDVARSDFNDVSKSMLPAVLKRKGAYHLLYHNLLRHSVPSEGEDNYYNALIAFLLCDTGKRSRGGVAGGYMGTDVNIIDDKQVIRNPQAWCILFKLFHHLPNNMQARGLQDFMLLLMYNAENRHAILSEVGWQWSFYPLLSKAFENAEKAKENQDDGSEENMTVYQDIFPLALRLVIILLQDACIHQASGWMEVEQLIILAPLTPNGKKITMAIFTNLLDAIKMEVESQLAKNIYWPANENSAAATHSFRTSPTGSSSSYSSYPHVLNNLTNLAAMIEHYVLSNGLLSLDGKPTTSDANVISKEESNPGESDFLLLTVKEQCESSKSDDTEDALVDDLSDENNRVDLELVKLLLSVYDHILFSVGSVANKILWSRCGSETENHPLSRRGPSIFVLLRLSIILLDKIHPCSSDARANAARLRILALSLMWGIRNTSVKSPSASVDLYEARDGPSKSMSDIGSMSELLEAVSSAGSSGARSNRTESDKGISLGGGRRSRASSLTENSIRRQLNLAGNIDGLYLLDEEEQWSMALIRSIKVALIKVREVIFGRTDHQNPNSEAATEAAGGARSTSSFSIADEVSALTFDVTKGNMNCNDNGDRDILMQVEMATTFADSLLRILADIVNGTRDILEDHLSEEHHDSLEQIVLMHQANRRGAPNYSGSNDTSEEIQACDLKECTGNAEAARAHHEAKVAVNSAVDRLMNWLYAPWLILPIEDTRGEGDGVAIFSLSETERVFCESMRNYGEYKWQLFTSWELAWSKTEISKILSNRARQSENTFDHKEVNRRASLAASEEDHLDASGRKWKELRDKLNLGSYFVDEINNSGNASHWMMSAREDGLRRRRLLCPNLEFNLHTDCRYGYGKQQLSSPLKTNLEDVPMSVHETPIVNSLLNIGTPGTLDKYSDKVDDLTLSVVKVVRDPSNAVGDDYEEEEIESGCSPIPPGGNSRSEPDGKEGIMDIAPKNGRDAECSEDDEDYRADQTDGNTGLESHHQTMFSLQNGEEIVFAATGVVWVTPLTVTRGRLDISNLHMFFYPAPHEAGSSSSLLSPSGMDGTSHVGIEPGKKENMRWSLRDLRHLFSRRYLLRSNAMEFFFTDQTNIFFSFEHLEDKESAWSTIGKYAPPSLDYGLPTTSSKEHSSHFIRGKVSKRRKSLTSYNPWHVLKRSGLTERWRRREISNFEYLMHLNTLAGRSYNDITQYPIFPWIIQDYESEELNLHDLTTYRDLSKPMGALNPDRLRQFLERYEMFDGGGIPKFHYGSHYSSAGVVLHYLIRLEPFTSLAISLQGGKFDCPDRLFFNISECWHSCLNSMSDVRELIPEFYSTPEFLINSDKFPLGKRQDGKMVGDVELPPWASTAHEFVRINAAALESEYVSLNLHKWIDLVFGYKQRGPEAESSHNLFYYLTYEGAVDLDSIVDPLERAATEAQIAHFGQTPSQLLRKPHPRRMAASEINLPFLVVPAGCPHKVANIKLVSEVMLVQKKQELNPPIVSISQVGDKMVTVYADMSIACHKWTKHQGDKGYIHKFEIQKRRYLSGAGAPSCLWNSNDWWSLSKPGNFVAPRNGPKRGRLIASSGYCDNTVKFHSLSGQMLQSAISDGSNHKDVVTCVTMCEDGMTLVTGSLDSTVRVWKVYGSGDVQASLNDMMDVLDRPDDSKHETAKWLHLSNILLAHKSPIACIAASSLLDIIVSGSKDGILAVHCISDGRRIRVWSYPNKAAPSLISLSKAGDIFVVSNVSHTLHMFSVNGATIGSADLHTRNVASVVVTVDSQHVLLAGDDRIVAVRSTSDLRVVKHHVIDEHHGAICCMELGFDHLICGMEDGNIVVLNAILTSSSGENEKAEESEEGT